MALVTRSATASLDKVQAEQVSAGLIAGEALDLVAACYIKSADGKVYMSDGAAANEAAEVVGFTARAVAIGQPVTLFGPGSRFKYGSALTPGDVYYLGTTAGRLDTAPTTGDAFGYARVESATDIVILRSLPVLTSATVGAGTISVTELANDAVETLKIKNVNVTQAKIEVGAAGAGLTGLITKFVAAANVIGGIPVVHWIHVTAGANGNTDVTLTHKTKVVYAIFLPSTTVAASTYQLKNVADAITDAVAVASAGTLGVPLTWDPTKTDIAAGTVLRVTGAGGVTMPAGDVYVFGFRVA
jgi:hypothetical protein